MSTTNTSTLNPRVGVGVLVFNKNNQILLGQRQGSHGHNSWQPPGGHLEFNESLENCVRREAKEEVDISLDNIEFIGMTNDYFEDSHKHYISIFMQATLAPNQQVKNCEPHKAKNWQWFNLEELPSPLFLPLGKLIERDGYGLKSLEPKAVEKLGI
jgi:8-oxo-dGTP diphosphatase